MVEILSSEKMVNLFTKQVHHYNVSVIFTLQNFYASSKHGKTLMRNLDYEIFFLYLMINQNHVYTLYVQ